MKNVLRYSIRDECLYGTVDKTSFSMKAFSGGGRGSTAGKERMDLRHWSTSKKAPDNYDEKNRGGPIPLGIYLATYYGRKGARLQWHSRVVSSSTGGVYEDRIIG